MKKKIYLIALAISSASTIFAQRQFPNKNPVIPPTTEQCGTGEIDKVMMLDPAYREARERVEEMTQSILNSSVQNKAAILTIPIVFHVIHKGEAIGTGTNISDAQIFSAIDALNRDYRKTAADGGIAQGAGADVEVEFCLAVRDENNNPHTGINRVDGTSVANYSSIGISYNSPSNELAVKALSKWDNRYYLNIWVVSEIHDNGADAADLSSFTGGTIGYSFFPTNPVTNNVAKDGVVILNCATGNDPTGTLGFRLWNFTKINRTLTHEVGHYLNLNHPFAGASCSEADCTTDGDKVCDTPPTVQNQDCDNPACGGTQQVENYMDYAGQYCKDMFTQGQVDRMRAAITGVRSELLTSLGCTPVSAVDLSIASIDYPTASICELEFSPEVVLTNYGSTTITSATINYDVDGGTNQVFNWTGSLAQSASANVTLPLVTTTAGTHTLNVATDAPNAVTDENTSNDANSQSFDAVVGNAITLNLVTDGFGADTEWEIVDDNNTVVASGGPYNNLFGPGTTDHIVDLCLPDGCYYFQITDVFGDGLCCAYGDGSYSLEKISPARVLASGADFDDIELTDFCVSLTDAIGENNFNIGIDIYPNPMNNKFIVELDQIDKNTGITITSIDGRIIYENPSVNSNKTNIDATAWSNGIYVVTIRNKDKNQTVKLIKQ